MDAALGLRWLASCEYLLLSYRFLRNESMFCAVFEKLCFFMWWKLATHIFRILLNIELIEAPPERAWNAAFSLSVWRLDIPYQGAES
ncbi:hypothetical protein EMIT0P228_30435 [Pseudomonas brassicacearum]